MSEQTNTGGGVTVTDIVIPHGDVPLAARIHRPADAGTKRLPTVVCTGSWLTVKEQMPDLYAAKLVPAGYAAVTFDFSGFGGSGGGLRQTEVPTRKMADLAAVVDFLRTLSTVDHDRIGVLAVCASAQYTVGALAWGLPIASFVGVAGWFHDLESVAPFYGGADGVADRLARASRAAAAVAAADEPPVVPAYHADDDRAAMSLPMDYYGNPDRGAVPTWRNAMSELSWFYWLQFDAFAAAGGAVRTPTLLVHSEKAVLPDNVRRIAAQLGDIARTEWLDGEQTDFYDRPAQVDAAVELAVRHFAAMGSTPVTDHSPDAVARAVGRFFRAVDARDWATVMALLADSVAVDYTSVFGGEPETVAGAELVTRWRGLLPGFDATQHFLGPLLGVDGDVVECNVRGHHALDGDVWMVAGWYRLAIERGGGPEPVRIAGIVLTASYETGPRELVERAQRRAG